MLSQQGDKQYAIKARNKISSHNEITVIISNRMKAYTSVAVAIFDINLLKVQIHWNSAMKI